MCWLDKTEKKLAASKSRFIGVSVASRWCYDYTRSNLVRKFTIPGARGCAKNGQPPKYIIKYINWLMISARIPGNWGFSHLFSHFSTTVVASDWIQFSALCTSILAWSKSPWSLYQPKNLTSNQQCVWTFDFLLELVIFVFHSKFRNSSSSLQFHIMFSLYNFIWNTSNIPVWVSSRFHGG